MERSLSVVDSVVTILDSSAGVEAQTITVWNQAKKYKLPNIVYLNKYDKQQADYKTCITELTRFLGARASLIQLPIKSSSNLSIIDVIRGRLLVWENPEKDFGSKFKVSDLGVSQLDQIYKDSAEEEREKLINHLADFDDDFASHVISCDKLSDVDSSILQAAVRKATLRRLMCPV